MPSTDAEFRFFTALPFEIQSKIFTEALCKPHVHWMRAEDYSHSNPNYWGLRYHRRYNDTSGYMLIRQLSHTSSVAANAVRLATAEKMRLPFNLTKQSKILGNMDASTDLVCVEFGKGRTNWRYNNWARRTQVYLPKRFHRETSIAQHGGIRRVAIVYNQGYTKTVADLHHVFKCCSPHPEGYAKPCNVCPAEVVGFLDTFPDLEAVYVIVRQGLEKVSKEKARVYKNTFFSIPKEEREQNNLEVFHDTRYSYVEVTPERATNLRPQTPRRWNDPIRLEDRISDAFNLIRDVRKEFTTPPGQVQFTMNLEKRQNLKITALLETHRV
ncbi:hypothetical protein V8F20_009201 [Naviculisporaceae sp. PSN 640]